MPTIFNQQLNNLLLLPRFGTSGPFDRNPPAPNTSTINGGFNTPTDYSFEGNVLSTSFTTPTVGQPMHLEIQLQTLNQYTTPSLKIDWTITTQITKFPGLDNWFSLPIDANKSQLNGTSSTGTIDCKISKDSIIYRINGKFVAQPTVAPWPLDSIAFDLTCKLYTDDTPNPSLFLLENYINNQAFRYLTQVPQSSLSPSLNMVFEWTSYAVNCSINNIQKPTGATSLQGTITLSDTTSSPLVTYLSLNFNASIDAQSQIKGALTNDCFAFNAIPINGSIRGNWSNSSLSFSVTNGQLISSGLDIVPLFTTTWTGNLNLSAS